MKVKINNRTVPLIPGTSLTLEENSPFNSLKLNGDKTFDFALPESDELKEATNHATHNQSTSSINNLVGSIHLGPLDIAKGTCRLKKKKGSVNQLDIIVPPGNIPSSFWNKNLREVPFPVHQLPAEEIIDPIWVLKRSDSGNGMISGKTVLFGQYYFAHSTTLKILYNGQSIFNHVFNLAGYAPEAKEDIAYSELLAAVAIYNEDPVIFGSEIHITKDEIAIVLRNGIATLEVQIERRIDSIRSVEVPDTYVFQELQQLTHQSSKSYIEQVTSNDAPVGTKKEYLCFPPIFAPKFYNEAADYNKTLNSRRGGVLELNMYDERIDFPLSPVFRYLYVLEMLFTMNGYSMEGTEWNKFDKLCLAPMVDFARQHEQAELPYNIYPKEVALASYMPNWTVAELLNEFQLLTGHVFDFDLVTMKVRLISSTSLLNSTPFELVKSIAVESDFENLTTYAVKYASIKEEELLDDEVKEFFGVNDEADADSSLSLRLLPLAPLPTDFDARKNYFRVTPTRTRRTNNTEDFQILDSTSIDAPDVFCYEVAKSTMFSLSDQEPTCRTLYIDANVSLLNDEYSLSKSESLSLYKSFVQPILNKRSGRRITRKVFLRPIDIINLKYNKIVHLKGSSYLIRQKTTVVMDGVEEYEVTLELEYLNP